MSGRPLHANSGRRRGRAAQGAEPVDRLHLAAGRRCWPGSRMRRRGPCWPSDGERATFYAGPADDRALSHRDRQLPRQSRLRRAGALGGAARRPAPSRPTSIVAVTADPAEGEGLTEAGNDLVEPVPMPDAGARGGCGLRRRAPRRAAVLQAQARPRRSGGAGAARAACAKDATDERSGKFPGALVAPQARGGERERRSAGAGRRSASVAPKPTRAPAQRRHDATLGRAERRRRPASRRSISRACRRSNSITAETDIRAFLAPGVPAELDPCGASPRLGADPDDPRFRRARRERTGTSPTPGAMPGFGPLEMTDELRRLVARIVGERGGRARGGEAESHRGSRRRHANVNRIRRADGENSRSADRSRRGRSWARRKMSRSTEPVTQQSSDLVQRNKNMLQSQHRPR